MEGLLTLFVALTALAVITQAIVLIAIYINSKRLGDQIDRFIRETREVMVPVKTITENLRVASANLVEIGAAAREQFRRVDTIVTETGEALHIQIERLDQERWYLNSADYAKYARDYYPTQKAVVEKLGLKQ